jgi:hypothetical protein
LLGQAFEWPASYPYSLYHSLHEYREYRFPLDRLGSRGYDSVNTSPSNARQKSNFSKNISGPGTNKTTLGRSVTIPLRSTHMRLTYRQKNIVPVGSVMFG